jgi:hypothetical protein
MYELSYTDLSYFVDVEMLCGQASLLERDRSMEEMCDKGCLMIFWMIINWLISFSC